MGFHPAAAFLVGDLKLHSADSIQPSADSGQQPAAVCGLRPAGFDAMVL